MLPGILSRVAVVPLFVHGAQASEVDLAGLMAETVLNFLRVRRLRRWIGTVDGVVVGWFDKP